MTEPMIEGSGCALHESFALQVLGPDMEPEFPDRCVVIIDPSAQCHSGMYIFAEVEGVRWFRQYQRGEDGRERLLALNSDFPAIELTGLDWQSLGVIIQRNIRRKIKRYDYEDAGPPATPRGPAVQAVDITGA